jgi:hypothetical protein
MSDAPFELVDAKDSFIDSDWFHHCRETRTPFVVVRSGEHSADVLWDYITLPPECDAELHRQPARVGARRPRHLRSLRHSRVLSPGQGDPHRLRSPAVRSRQECGGGALRSDRRLPPVAEARPCRRHARDRPGRLASGPRQRRRIRARSGSKQSAPRLPRKVLQHQEKHKIGLLRSPAITRSCVSRLDILVECPKLPTYGGTDRIPRHTPNIALVTRPTVYRGEIAC